MWNRTINKWGLMLLVLILLSACTPDKAAPAETKTFAPVVVSGAEADAEPQFTPEEIDQIDQSTPVSAVESPAAATAPDQADIVKFQIVPGESKVSYEVGETFFDQNNRFNLAVGITTQVTGEVVINTSDPRKAEIGEIHVDISQFKSDSSRRDNAIRGRWLESSTYPIAAFKPTAIEGLPEHASEGQDLAFMVRGDLTVRQITMSVTFNVTARLENNLLTGNASTTILMSQFGVGPISMAGLLKTEDQVKITFEFVAHPQ